MLIRFEKAWAKQLSEAINVFVTLISEGSQANRQRFIKSFVRPYEEKYQRTQIDLKSGRCVMQTSEGGTSMCLDASKTQAVLDIPSPAILNTEIYHQTFKVMGDEWGKRFSNNLIKRDELVDLLRRSKTALTEVSSPISSEGRLEGNLGVIKMAFRLSYGTDADNVFDSLVKDAGYVLTTPTVAPVELPAAAATSTDAPVANKPYRKK